MNPGTNHTLKPPHATTWPQGIFIISSKKHTRFFNSQRKWNTLKISRRPNTSRLSKIEICKTYIIVGLDFMCVMGNDSLWPSCFKIWNGTMWTYCSCSATSICWTWSWRGKYGHGGDWGLQTVCGGKIQNKAERRKKSKVSAKSRTQIVTLSLLTLNSPLKFLLKDKN